MKTPCIYIVSNRPNGTLYIGVTSNLPKRIYEHKHHLVKGFTERYNLTKLVYYESVADMFTAIAREKQLKAGSRKKKVALIESMNPRWDDLYPRII